MNKIKMGFLVLQNKVRFGVMNAFSGRAKKVQVSGLTLISPNSAIEVGRGAMLRIDHKTRVEGNTLIGVRDHASIEIGKAAYINRNCVIVAHEKIVIEDGVQIGPNVCIYDHDHDLEKRGQVIAQGIRIEENAWISAGVIILKGVTIGKNAVIAAGCVVTKDVPDNSVLVQKRVSSVHVKK